MNWCPNDGWEVSVMSIPSLDNSKYKVHKPRINIICLRSRGSPLKHKEEMEEVADRTLAPVTSSGCPRKRGKVRAQQRESQGPITVSVIAVSVKCTCLQGEGGDSGTSLTF